MHHRPRAPHICIAGSQRGCAPEDGPADAMVSQDEGPGLPSAVPARATRAQRRAMLTLHNAAARRWAATYRDGSRCSKLL